MASKETSASERISASYKELSAAAVDLNAVSDELGKSISALDNALKKLNLGISAWVKITGQEDTVGSGDFWARYLGYAKIGGRWGIAISDVAGNYNTMPPDHDEEWLFNDAPRAFRVEAVPLLPDLLEKLIEEAHETKNKILDKTAQAKELAAAVTELAQTQRRKQ